MMILSNSLNSKKVCLVFSAFFLVFFSVHAQNKIWKIDPAHSNIGFSISYFNVGEIKGTFNNYSGSLISLDPITKESTLNITIESASINTNQAKRDEHLRTNDFFNTNEYSEIRFTSTSFKTTSDNSYELEGKLTMRGITKPITLTAIYKGEYTHPRFKNNRKFFSITGVILREDFEVGTNYSPAKFALGKKVVLTAEIQLIEE